MEQRSKASFMERLAAGIVDKRNFVFLGFVLAVIFSIFSRNWVGVNDDLTKYLGADSETRQGLDIMDEEFTEFATAKVVVANITYDKAEELLPLIETVEGVHSVDFDETRDHYNSAAALYSVTFDGDIESSVSLAAMGEIKSRLAEYDLYVSSEVGSPMEETIKSEMIVVLLIAFSVVLIVLVFTSHTYMEIPVLLITFGCAALLNMGTNFIFGTISYVTNSICVVLQLALAVDYAIILCHRYTEERESKDAYNSVVAALSKAIPEVGASSLTTVSGLIALTLMHFRLGYDMGIVLIKAIFISMLCVFLLMPGLLMVFSRAIDRTHHRNFVPKIDLWGKFVIKTRFIVPPLFLVVLVAAFIFANRCPYVYGYSTLDTIKQNDQKIAEKFINSTFGTENFTALIVPSGNYGKEAALLKELESYGEVESTLGLANIEVTDEYTLTSELTPRQFAELTDLDVEVARLLYTGYAVRDEAYGQIVSDIDGYTVPIIDMFLYLYEQNEEGYVTLDSETEDSLDEMYEEITFAQVQLEGENYSRFVIYLDLPEESEETFEFLDTIHAVTAKYYGEAYLVGNSINEKVLQASFSDDNLLISILSALFVIAVLLVTFRSVGLPLLLILVIQSSIWINFSVPYLLSRNLFFIAYLIVSAIQMGANIDYAIVISSRYMDLKTKMPIREAMITALNQAFPTIITSGCMMAAAGMIIGYLTSDNTISSIGFCLGRGTIISIILVMGVLPQILLLGDLLIEKTAFQIKTPQITHVEGSTIRINGRVRGQISGYIDADVRGVFQGTLHAMVESGAKPAEHPAELTGGKEEALENE